MIVLFDGICNLCNSSVDFIIRRDKKDVFKFASLQSEFGQKKLKELNIENCNTIILIENEKYYTKSTAVLKILKELNFFWKLFYVFIIIPKFIRNFMYDLISKNRYKWFGKKQTCRIPTPEELKKFMQ